MVVGLLEYGSHQHIQELCGKTNFTSNAVLAACISYLIDGKCICCDPIFIIASMTSRSVTDIVDFVTLNEFSVILSFCKTLGF